MTQLHSGIWRDFQSGTWFKGFRPFTAELQILLFHIRVRRLTDVAISYRTAAVQLVDIVTQRVIPAHTVVKGHLMLQAKELAVAAGDAVITRFLRTVAVQKGDTVLQAHGLVFAQVEGFTQRQHVVLGIVTQLSTRIAFRHHVKCQTVAHLRCCLGQHTEAVAQYAGFTEHSGGLAPADLF